MKQLYINKRRRLICTLIVAVFALVTVLEPLTAVATEIGNDQTQAQSGNDQTQSENQQQMELQDQTQDEPQDTQTQKNQWVEMSGNSYYFDSNGVMVTGAVDIEGITYYFDSNGALQKSKWVRINDEKYYVDANGIVQKGFCADIKVTAPRIEQWTRLSATTMKLTWRNMDANADGYEIRYAKDSAFTTVAGSTIVDAPATVTKTIENLDNNKKYYVEIRAFIKSAGQKYCSEWSRYANVKTDRTAPASILTRYGSVFELNSSAGQTTGQYDVVQGSCTDGTYAYYILHNKSNGMNKILKSRMSDNATIQVSGALALDHANDITYNSDAKAIAVVHYSGKPYRVSFVDPSTLTVTSYADIKIPKTLEGASTSNLAAITGFSGIAYNSERGQYVVRINKSHNYLILDKAMTPVKYVAVSRAGGNLNQGIDANNDYIFDVQSRAGYYNTVMAYDWDGEYQYTIKIPVSYEMESLFHNGNKLYASVYSSYYQTYYTTHYKTYKVKWKRVKTKWKKVKGKWKYKYTWKYKTKYKYKTVKTKVKWKKSKVRTKKVNGKWQYKYVWKYKTKKKKVKDTYTVAHRRLIRNNYVYSVGTI